MLDLIIGLIQDDTLAKTEYEFSDLRSAAQNILNKGLEQLRYNKSLPLTHVKSMKSRSIYKNGLRSIII